MRKIILVTGASSGIGFDAAQTLARQGHRVYAAARRVERMEPLKADGIVPVRMDVTDEASLQEGVRTVLEAEGRIDVLVNNAGYGYFGAIENVSLNEARRQLEVNVFGLARLCQLVLPAMRKQGSGRIVNISSVAGKAVLYFGGWYHVSKYSVEALSDALRMEVKPFGIDVSLIEPGGIKTDWGIIAADHLADSSKGTPYEKEGLRESETIRKAYSIRLLSKPAVVTRAISRAVNSRRPRTRYRIGFGAGALVFFHSLLPDRWWDALMRQGGKIRF
ncbi:MAG: oxidoreductase [Bacteroidales bacterium]|nr:oxidoreductase [Bacteroidales bacterium]